MSSLNPIVGVSLCIGALGAGLAYLAYNNNDDENEEEIKPEPQEIKPEPQEIKPEPQEVKPDPQEIKPEPQEVKPDPQEVKPTSTDDESKEIKHKPSEDGKKRTNMQQFLQDAYEKTN